jgi:predicted nucleic acid-binding Zn ribbon protein
MPLYHYQCLDCQAGDQRLAGLDDHTALCTGCTGVMLRLEDGVFAPYSEVGAALPVNGRKVQSSRFKVQS